MVDRLFFWLFLDRLDSVRVAICLRGWDLVRRAKWNIRKEKGSKPLALSDVDSLAGVCAAGCLLAALARFVLFGTGAGKSFSLFVGGNEAAGCFGSAGCGVLVAGWACVTAGELAALRLVCTNGGVMPGGGGNGEMPTLSLAAAAAAAADAYLRPSPTGLVGTDAGFMLPLLVLPLLIADNGVCNVARAGNGDFVCVVGFFVAAGSTTSFCTFLTGFGGSGSCISSWTDWLSWDDPFSFSCPRP